MYFYFYFFICLLKKFPLPSAHILRDQSLGFSNMLTFFYALPNESFHHKPIRTQELHFY